MTDFSMLTAVKTYLQSNIKDMNFYLTKTSEDEKPFCVVELDGALASVGYLNGHEAALPSKVKFRTVCFHDEMSMQNSLDRSQLINKFLDGSVIKLKGGGAATIKLMGSHVDICKSGQKKTVINFYESLIRG